MKKTYEIEILYCETCNPKKLNRKFKTFKSAREWCERNGMTAIFGGKRPSMFWSAKTRNGMRGFTATIREVNNVHWIATSTEGNFIHRF